MVEFIIIFAAITAILYFGYRAMYFIWQEHEIDKKKEIIFVKVEGRDETVEARLRLMMGGYNWSGADLDTQIIVVDCGTDAETRKILELFVKENSAVALCTLSEAHRYIKRSGLRGTALNFRS